MSRAISLITFFLVALLVHRSSALIAGEQDQLWLNLQRQQQHSLRARTDCRIESLTAQEPTIRFESEAGRTEFWDQNNKQFECANVVAVRNFIEPSGLLLPHYNNAPQLLYVVQGRGLLGVVIPGCAETFEEESQAGVRGEQRRRFVDRHQKVREFRQGDVLALPAGYTIWFYNNGNEQLQTVALLDTGSEINQLDQTFRNFFLAGKPQTLPQGYYRGAYRREEQQGQKNNIFYGFDEELLEEIFQVDRETVRKLRSENDDRGHIVRAEKFDIVFPREEEEERQRRETGRWMVNGMEETFCSAKLTHNLDEPTRADVYNPRGGRISTLNSQKLPILNWLRLSAEKGVLYRNAIMAPYHHINAHSAIYITRGSGRFQVVGHTGKSVFDGEVREGQMIIVPQNFVVVKKANEEEGLEWIAFKTNDNAITSQLAGRLSTFRALPEEVLMNAYDISRDDAKRLKYRREESKVFSGRSQSRPRTLEYALNVIKTMM